MQSDIARVRSEHDALDRRADDLQDVISAGPSRCEEAFDRLAAYANVLSEHLLGEHEVLEAAHQRGDGTVRFGGMRSEIEVLRWDWEEFLSVWTAESAKVDWETFSEHSLTILDRIKRRIERENQLLDT